MRTTAINDACVCQSASLNVTRLCFTKLRRAKTASRIAILFALERLFGIRETPTARVRGFDVAFVKLLCPVVFVVICNGETLISL